MKIVLEINGKEVILDVNEAKRLHRELDSLFGNKNPFDRMEPFKKPSLEPFKKFWDNPFKYKKDIS